MCDKLYLKQRYCNPRKDVCLVKFIERINKYSPFRTLASCCGHGVYHPTMVIKDKDGNLFELFSRKKIEIKKRNRYYKSDDAGYYYIPEVMDI